MGVLPRDFRQGRRPAPGWQNAHRARPDLPDAELPARLGRELFGADWQGEQVEDLFELFRVLNTDRDWSVPGALTTPGLVRHRAEHGRLDAKKRALIREQLARVRAIAARYREASTGGAKELHRIAQWLANQPEHEQALSGTHGRANRGWRLDCTKSKPVSAFN